jgi:hypothetical protein
MKRLSFSLSALALSLLSTSALAEPSASTQPPAVGDLMRPDAEVIRTRRRSGRRSLIDVRSQYVAELLKSVEDL